MVCKEDTKIILVRAECLNIQFMEARVSCSREGYKQAREGAESQVSSEVCVCVCGYEYTIIIFNLKISMLSMER